MVRRRLTRIGNAAVSWLLGLLYVGTALDSGLSAPRAAAGVVLGAALGVVLARRRQHPELVAAVVVVLDLGFHALVPGLVIPFAGLVALWGVTLVRPPRISLWALAGVSGVALLNAFRTSADETVFTLLLGATVWALAEAARNRITAEHEAAQRAVADERARLARELHDVIAHGVSVVVVQAAAASDVFDDRPDQARAALTSIERTGREALAELRRVVAVVRPDEEAPAATAPQPGLTDLDALAAQLGTAGLDVVVRHEGPRVPLPAGVELSAYRIVQEALTNTLRHARATTAEVTLRYDADAVEIDVVDDGRAAPVPAGAAGGFGLVGMRERASALGGTLDAGPTAHGSFRVRARLPFGAAS
jgi:signal transduction histidine kinase